MAVAFAAFVDALHQLPLPEGPQPLVQGVGAAEGENSDHDPG